MTFLFMPWSDTPHIRSCVRSSLQETRNLSEDRDLLWKQSRFQIIHLLGNSGLSLRFCLGAKRQLDFWCLKVVWPSINEIPTYPWKQNVGISQGLMELPETVEFMISVLDFVKLRFFLFVENRTQDSWRLDKGRLNQTFLTGKMHSERGEKGYCYVVHPAKAFTDGIFWWSSCPVQM